MITDKMITLGNHAAQEAWRADHGHGFGLDSDFTRIVSAVLSVVEPLILEQLRDQAASATIHTDNEIATLDTDDPHGVGWVPVSIGLIQSLVDNRNADVERIRADEREKTAQRIERAAQQRWQRKELPQGMFFSARVAREGKDD